jgi:Castor and Pollux, part of voltage-gated ion channel
MRRSGGSQKSSLRVRARYAFDNAMARGSGAIVALLGVVLLCVVGAFTIVSAILGTADDPVSTTYNILLQTIIGGGDLEQTGLVAALLFLLITIVGILIFGAFIGTIVTGMDSRLQQLRQGRSLVLERDHTLILGWSPRVFVIVSELVIANQSRVRPRIVILAERPKADMEDAIREQVPDRSNTRVICRTGNPVVAGDLELVNHRQARSVIVLGEDASDRPDADVIKTLLALTRDGGGDIPGRHIVAEIQDAASEQAARLIDDDILLINKPETVARLIVQTSRQAGAAAVYRDILDFASSEIYMRADQRLAGMTYLDAMLGYEECAVIGLMHADRTIVLNPSAGTVIDDGDMVIAVAEDDSVLDGAAYARAPTVGEQIAIQPTPPAKAEDTLILGYNRRTPLVISELGSYAEPGSRALLVSDVPLDASALTVARAAGSLELEVREGNTDDRCVLDALDVPSYDRVIVMSYADDLAPKHAGARLLLTLLHLRDIAASSGSDIAIVSEILDKEDTDLVHDAGVNDIVVSDEVLSLMLTQVAENRYLADVFRQLFQAAGSEVYLRPVEYYVKTEQPANFATLIEAASRRSESAFGYWSAALADKGDARSGMRVNPAKSEVFDVAPGDRLIVLAEQ